MLCCLLLMAMGSAVELPSYRAFTSAPSLVEVLPDRSFGILLPCALCNGESLEWSKAFLLAP